jgi:hypothetical protein
VIRTTPTIAPLISMLVLLLGWAAPPASAQSEDPYSLVDEYPEGDFGRVVYQENGLRIERAFVEPGAAPGEQVGINAPVFPGDTVITDGDQRAEVQLADGTLVRIDRGTEVTFMALPDPYAEFADNTVLQLKEGSIRLTTRLSEGEEFRIDTAASSVYVLGDGDFRIDVTPGGRTEVISRGGVAEVVGSGGSILVHGGMRTEVYAGNLPEDPWAFNTFVTDNFDRWVDEREFVYGASDRFAGGAEYSAETHQTLPVEVQPYYEELEYYGDWTHVPDYGNVWYPTLVGAGWSPYRDGYWSDGPGGWFWVSNEPWGWAPYHYGRWNWLTGYGWCWTPGRVFAGAWVAWSWGSVHVGWAPLDYWGRPAYVRVTHHGYYDPQAWVFVDYSHVGHRDYQRYAVNVGVVGDELRHATVVARTPRVPPTRLAQSPESREFARRMARADHASWMRPVDRESRPDTGMRDVERRMADRHGASFASRGRSSTANASSRPTSRDITTTSRNGFPVYPRQTRDATRSADSRRNVARRSSISRSSVSRDVGTTRERRSLDARGSTTQERVRDLYRKMATPDSSSTRGRSQTTRTMKAPATPRRSSKARSGRSRSKESTVGPQRSSGQDPRAGSRDTRGKKRSETGQRPARRGNGGSSVSRTGSSRSAPRRTPTHGSRASGASTNRGGPSRQSVRSRPTRSTTRTTPAPKTPRRSSGAKRTPSRSSSSSSRSRGRSGNKR